MNGIMNVGLSINSREISEMVEKRHDSGKWTIETLIGQGLSLNHKVWTSPTKMAQDELLL